MEDVGFECSTCKTPKPVKPSLRAYCRLHQSRTKISPSKIE